MLLSSPTSFLSNDNSNNNNNDANNNDGTTSTGIREETPTPTPTPTPKPKPKPTPEPTPEITNNPIIAVGQLCSKSSKYENLLNIARCAGWAKRSNCVMLFIPECFGFMGANSQETIDNSEPPIDTTVDNNNNNNNDSNNDNKSSTSINNKKIQKALMEMVQQSAYEESSSSTQPSIGNDWDVDIATGNETVATTSQSIVDDDTITNPNMISLVEGLQIIARTSNMWISAGGMHVRVVTDTSPTSTCTTASTTQTTTTGTITPENNDNDTNKQQQQQQHQQSSSSSSSPSPSQRVYNTHIVIDNTGSIQCLYRKIHLFDVSIPGKVQLRESATTAPGTEAVICDSPIGRLGLTVCYDVRFPELYIELVQQRGAEILLVPAAFTVPTGTAHWHTLLKARAIENQCYVIAAAQYGKHNEKRESYGHSLVIDPWGVIVVDAGGCDGPGTSHQHQQQQHVQTPSIVTCEIDRTYIQSIRQRIPIQIHRKNASFSTVHIV